jgi:hypothetical protein
MNETLYTYFYSVANENGFPVNQSILLTRDQLIEITGGIDPAISINK